MTLSLFPIISSCFLPSTLWLSLLTCAAAAAAAEKDLLLLLLLVVTHDHFFGSLFIEPHFHLTLFSVSLLLVYL